MLKSFCCCQMLKLFQDRGVFPSGDRCLEGIHMMHILLEFLRHNRTTEPGSYSIVVKVYG